MKNNDQAIGLVILLAGLLIVPAFSCAETITLKSGQKIEGKIIEQTKDYVKIDILGVTTTYFIDEIQGGASESLGGEKKESGTPLAAKSSLEKKKVSDADILREYFLKGADALVQGKYEEAKEFFNKALAITPGDEFSSFALQLMDSYANHVASEDVLRSVLQGLTLFVSGKRQDAIVFAKSLTEKNPDSKPGYILTGYFYLIVGQSKEAVYYLNQAIHLKSNDFKLAKLVDPLAYSYLGRSYLGLAQQKEALESFAKAAELLRENGKIKEAERVEGYITKISNK